MVIEQHLSAMRSSGLRKARSASDVAHVTSPDVLLRFVDPLVPPSSLIDNMESSRADPGKLVYVLDGEVGSRPARTHMADTVPRLPKSWQAVRLPANACSNRLTSPTVHIQAEVQQDSTTKSPTQPDTLNTLPVIHKLRKSPGAGVAVKSQRLSSAPTKLPRAAGQKRMVVSEPRPSSTPATALAASRAEKSSRIDSTMRSLARPSAGKLHGSINNFVRRPKLCHTTANAVESTSGSGTEGSPSISTGSFASRTSIAGESAKVEGLPEETLAFLQTTLHSRGSGTGCHTHQRVRDDCPRCLMRQLTPKASECRRVGGGFVLLTKTSDSGDFSGHGAWRPGGAAGRPGGGMAETINVGGVLQSDGTTLLADGTRIFADGRRILADGTILDANGNVIGNAHDCEILADGTMVMKDGTRILKDGTRLLSDGTRVMADGSRVLADGTRVMKNGTRILADGSVVLADGTTLPPGAKVLPDGTILLADGSKMLANGTKLMADGTRVLADGTKLFADGTKILADGTKVLANGTKILADGTRVLPDGTQIMADGSRVLADGTVILADGTRITGKAAKAYLEHQERERRKKARGRKPGESDEAYVARMKASGLWDTMAGDMCSDLCVWAMQNYDGLVETSMLTPFFDKFPDYKLVLATFEPFVRRPVKLWAKLRRSVVKDIGFGGAVEKMIIRDKAMKAFCADPSNAAQLGYEDPV